MVRNKGSVKRTSGVLIGPPGWSGRPLFERLFVCDPILFRVVEGINELRINLECPRNEQHCSCVLMSRAVISRWENSDERAPSESFEPIHHTLMGSQNHCEVIIFQEIADSVWPKLHNVARSVGISDEVRLDTNFVIIVSGIRPQNVDHQLLLLSRHFMDYF